MRMEAGPIVSGQAVVADLYIKCSSQVTGYANELQMLTGIEAYQNRPLYLTALYNRLYTLHREQLSTCPHKLLRVSPCYAASRF